MTTKITKKQVERLARQAVRDRGGDTVVNHCVYRDKGAPVCLVGQVVSYLTDKPLGRVFDKDLNEMDWSEVSPVVGKRIGVEFTAGANDALYRLQFQQDRGATWKSVVKSVFKDR